MSFSDLFPTGKGLSREAIRNLQLKALRELLSEILPSNRFYNNKLQGAGFSAKEIPSLSRIDDMGNFPFTTKGEIQKDQDAHPPFGTNLTYPLERYTRLHQTSGTTGRSIKWLDTPESWDALQAVWGTIYDAAGIRPGERLFFPFSFGPFLGFWAAFDGAQKKGLLAIPGGGMSSVTRLGFLQENEISGVLCTPTYALRLAEVAREKGIDLAGGPVRALIVAGEPGGNIPAVRRQIEEAWGARCFDHWGMTEVGPIAFETAGAPGELSILETECIAEVIDPATGKSVPPGSQGELIITTLKRTGSPLIRYRTGDLVTCSEDPSPDGLHFLRLPGGILGRIDDMVLIRGNNVYPSALEAVLRRIPQVAEYRAIVVKRGGTAADLRLIVEPVPGAEPEILLNEIRRAIQESLFFRPDVQLAPARSLPRFEMKARRFLFPEKEDETPRL